MCNTGYTPVTKPLIFPNFPSNVLGCLEFFFWGGRGGSPLQINMIYCLANPFKEKASKTFK